MPIHHVQLSDTTHKSHRAGPAATLRLNGPEVQVSVGLRGAISDELAAEGREVPGLIAAKGLIDTGAQATCVDMRIIAGLGVQMIRYTDVRSASHASIPMPVYPLRISIMGLGNGFDLNVIGSESLATFNVDVLIGRDILQKCTMFYNGLGGHFTLAR